MSRSPRGDRQQLHSDLRPARRNHRRRPYRTHIFLTLTTILAACMWLTALPAPASALPANDLFFVHLGHIWRWDGDLSQVYPFTQPNGNQVGNMAWSVNGNCVAWTETTPGNPGSQRVHVKEKVGNPVGPWTEHVIPIAYADHAAVSPDGQRVMVQVDYAGGPTTYEVMVQTGLVVATRPGWCNAQWSPSGAWITYNTDPQNFPSNAGFWLYYLPTAATVQVPVQFFGEIPQDSNAWAPQWSPTANSILVTKYVNSTQRIVLADITSAGGVVTQKVDVTDYDSHDKRWYYTPSGHERIYVETTPPSGGEPTISELTAGPTPILWPRFQESSFGLNASLPGDNPFTDVPYGSWYHHAVVMMRIKQLISGYDDLTFRPSNPLLRAQFAKMIATTAKLAATEGMALPPFTDLGPDDPTSLYPHEYIAAAYNAGIIKGTTATTFSPWANVTRAQAMTMIVRAADELWPGLLDPVPGGFIGYLAWFQDPTHGAQARKAEWNNLLLGITLPGWDPWANANRAEVAQMLFNLLEVYGPEWRLWVVT